MQMAWGAGGILNKYFKEVGVSARHLEVEYKDEQGRDPVTRADKESQAYLKRCIERLYPTHGILGEEDEEDDSVSPDTVWILDPLDGTRNFLHGLPVYACSVGVIHLGVPVVGAVFVPWPCTDGGIVLHAHKGGGAYIDGKMIQSSNEKVLDPNALISIPGSLRKTHGFTKSQRDDIGEVRVTGSIAYEFAMVAMGVLQYSLVTAPHLWDVVGGLVLVREAGGLVLKSSHDSQTWEDDDMLISSWTSGTTTFNDLRDWVESLIAGRPDAVRHITLNRNRWSNPIGRLKEILWD